MPRVINKEYFSIAELSSSLFLMFGIIVFVTYFEIPVWFTPIEAEPFEVYPRQIFLPPGIVSWPIQGFHYVALPLSVLGRECITLLIMLCHSLLVCVRRLLLIGDLQTCLTPLSYINGDGGVFFCWFGIT